MRKWSIGLIFSWICPTLLVAALLSPRNSRAEGGEYSPQFVNSRILSNGVYYVLPSNMRLFESIDFPRRDADAFLDALAASREVPIGSHILVKSTGKAMGRTWYEVDLAIPGRDGIQTGWLDSSKLQPVVFVEGKVGVSYNLPASLTPSDGLIHEPITHLPAASAVRIAADRSGTTDLGLSLAEIRSLLAQIGEFEESSHSTPDGLQYTDFTEPPLLVQLLGSSSRPTSLVLLLKSETHNADVSVDQSMKKALQILKALLPSDGSRVFSDFARIRNAETSASKSEKVDGLDITMGKFGGVTSIRVSARTKELAAQARQYAIENPPDPTFLVSKKDRDREGHSATVYITDHGEKFHRSGCRSLWKSRLPISRLSAISQGYDSCDSCKP